MAVLRANSVAWRWHQGGRACYKSRLQHTVPGGFFRLSLYHSLPALWRLPLPVRWRILWATTAGGRRAGRSWWATRRTGVRLAVLFSDVACAYSDMEITGDGGFWGGESGEPLPGAVKGGRRRLRRMLACGLSRYSGQHHCREALVDFLPVVLWAGGALDSVSGELPAQSKRWHRRRFAPLMPALLQMSLPAAPRRAFYPRCITLVSLLDMRRWRFEIYRQRRAGGRTADLVWASLRCMPASLLPIWRRCHLPGTAGRASLLLLCRLLLREDEGLPDRLRAAYSGWAGTVSMHTTFFSIPTIGVRPVQTTVLA